MDDWIRSEDGVETVREDHDAVIRRQSAEIARLTAERDAAHLAIRWALGEAADHNGHWFGNHVTESGRPKAYWWRTHLRNLSRLPPQQRPRTDK